MQQAPKIWHSSSNWGRHIGAEAGGVDGFAASYHEAFGDLSNLPERDAHTMPLCPTETVKIKCSVLSIICFISLSVFKSSILAY